MCCYKLVTCEFKWFGLQGTVESRIQKVGVTYSYDFNSSVGLQVKEVIG